MITHKKNIYWGIIIISISVFMFVSYVLRVNAQGTAALTQFYRNLSLGSQGQDVRILQETLSADPVIYPEGLITGYFGRLTSQAVSRYQARNGLSVTGELGSRTIAKLNALLIQRSGFSNNPASGFISVPEVSQKQTTAFGKPPLDPPSSPSAAVLAPLQNLPVPYIPFNPVNPESQQPSTSQDSEPAFSSNELLIKVTPQTKRLIKANPAPTDTGVASLNALNVRNNVLKFEKVAKEGVKSKTDAAVFQWYKITLPYAQRAVKRNSASPAEIGPLFNAMQDFKKNSSVEAVEQNYVYSIQAIPNDPYYSSSGAWGQSWPDLWGMKIINAAGAWDQTTGSTNIVVAGIDTGVDRNHPDIAGNMWVNTAETPGNGVDDDRNGYIDDYYGWDFNHRDNDPMDDHGHGTHTAGTIAAVGNNGLGVVGVNWISKIMALKFLSASGSGYLDDGIKALQYAADMGARVSSNSWGCGCQARAMDDAVKYEHDRGMVVVTAAGNSSSNALDFSPASADYAITVSATNHNDALASFSNRGEKIDVGAPGGDAAKTGGIDDYILSARASNNTMCGSANTIGTNYCIVRGTSMAAPHVAGLAALIISKNPNLTNEEIRQIIRSGADDLGAVGKDLSFGYGRINANSSIIKASSHVLAPVITGPSSRTMVTGSPLQVFGSTPGPNFSSYKLELGAGRSPTTWTTLRTSNVPVSTNSLLTTVDTTTLADGTYTFRLTATDTGGKDYQFQVYDITVDNFDAEITFPTGLVSLGSINITGTARTKNGLNFTNYAIEWGVGPAPSSWSNSGIILQNDGLQPITNGALGTWDTSNLTDGQAYTLRLTVTSSLGTKFSSITTIRADKDQVSGWAKQFTNASYGSMPHPVFADLDGEGTKEVVVVPNDQVYVFRKNGSNFPGFPVSLDLGDYSEHGAVVSDLDGNGRKEVIVSAYNPNRHATKTYIFQSDGRPYPGWVPPVIEASSAAVADLNRDGTKELVMLELLTYTTRVDIKVHAFTLTGSELTGFPKLYSSILPTNLWYLDQPPSIADLDGDGYPEIMWSTANRMFVFDRQGNILPGWPFVAPDYNNLPMFFESAAASGDVDGDGQLEIFSVAHGDGCAGGIPYCGTELYGWKKDGTVLPGWPKTDQTDNLGAGYDITTETPALSDMDGDGKDEIIVGYGKLIIFDLEGRKPLLDPVFGFTRTPLYMNQQPALLDIDGDGRLEYAGDGFIAKEDGTQFTVFWNRFSVLTNQELYYPAVADLDNNGKIEFAVMGRPSSSTSAGSTSFTIYLWEIPSAGPTSAATTLDWPMFSHDPQRSGRLLNIPSPVDNIPPTVSITSPPTGTTYTSSQTVTISASASDNVGVAKVEFYDNGLLQGTDTVSSYAYSWSITSAQNGTHSWTAKAYDAAGNVGVSSVVSLIVNIPIPDTTPPSIPANVTATPVSSSQINLSWNPSTDNVGVTGYRVYRGGVQIATTAGTNYQNTGLLANTTYSYTVAAYDAAGNVSAQSVPASATTFPAPDTQPPTVSITSPSTGSTYTTTQTVTINASASDNVGVTKVEFYDNGLLQGTDTVSSYAYSWSITSAQNGTHSWTAKAYDAAGNSTVSSPVSLTVSISAADTTPPSPVTNLNTNSPTASSLSLSWTAPGDDGTAGTAASYDIRYSTSPINDSNWPFATQAVSEPTPLTSGSFQSFTVSGLSCGTTYYFAIKTNDEAGNISLLSNIPLGTTNACAPATGSIMIKRVGSDLTTATAPPGTTAQVDTGIISTNNPATFTLLAAGSHLAKATDASGFTETAGTCQYQIGAVECTISSFPIIPTCNGSTCSTSVSVTAGYVTKTVFRYLTGDTQPPTVSITSPLNGATVPRRSTVTITATAFDNVGVARVEFYVNGSYTCTDTTFPYTCSWRVPNQPNKNYQLQARAYDAVGNTNASILVTVTSIR